MKFSHLIALFVSSTLATLVERQNEKPTGLVDPSTIKDCTFWYNFSSGNYFLYISTCWVIYLSSRTGDTCDKIQSQYLLTRDQLVLYVSWLRSS